MRSSQSCFSATITLLCTVFAFLLFSNDFANAISFTASKIGVTRRFHEFGRLSQSSLEVGADDDKGGDPDAYVPHRVYVHKQGDDDDKGGDPDAYVPQGRFCNQPMNFRGDDDDKGGDPDAYVPQGRFCTKPMNLRGDDDDKGGDPDAYVPQGRSCNKVSRLAAQCLYIRGGAGNKGAKVANSTATKAKSGNGKAKSGKAK